MADHRMSLTYGALFAGYGGLELGVQSVLGGHLAWYAEIDPGTAAWVADALSERAA